MIGEHNRTLEQVYRSAVSGLYARLKSNYDFIYQRFGNDGIRLIAEMSREYGLSVARRAKKSLKGNDLNSVVGYLLRVFDTVGRGSNLTSLVEHTSTRATVRIDCCPLGFDKAEMCLAHTSMEKAMVEELNPRLSYRIGKSVPAGDGYCEHIIEVKT